jgi:hypothetical protein
MTGSETAVGAWLVTAVLAEKITAVPREFAFVVLAVTNFPASADTCVYVEEVASICEHPAGKELIALGTETLQRNHW